MDVSIKSNKYNISFELNHKFSVLTGNSAIGKTTLASLLVSDIPNVEITSTHDISILTKAIFKNTMKRIERFYANQNQILPIADTDEHRKQRIKMLNDYWKNEDNQLVWNQLVIIDDEDFVSSLEFACMYNHDKTNYYLVINRINISTIGFSVEAIYTLKSLEYNYVLEPVYSMNNGLLPEYDYYLVEGSGSDYALFSHLFGDKTICPTFRGLYDTGGRTKVSSLIDKCDELSGSRILCFIDICAYGANIESLLTVCRDNNVMLTFAPKYQSFEQYLLMSYFNDSDVKAYRDSHFIEFKSDEVLYEARLQNIITEDLIFYNKSITDFKNCFIKPCGCYSNIKCKYRINREAIKLQRYFRNGFEYLKHFTVVNKDSQTGKSKLSEIDVFE